MKSMKRINSLFELFVLVVFPELTVATPPMFSGCIPSSSSAVEHSDSYSFDLIFFTQSDSTGIRMYFNACIYLKVYAIHSKLEYILIASNGDHVLTNTDHDTEVVFQIGNKLKIRTKDNDNASVSYTLDFEQANEANLAANFIISADSQRARYKKCKGSHSYKLEKLYKRSTAGTYMDVGENWCIFKIRKRDESNVTTFMIRWIAKLEEHRMATCVFRSTDYRLAAFPDANNKLELSILLAGEIVDPKYVLETSRVDQMQEFFNST